MKDTDSISRDVVDSLATAGGEIRKIRTAVSKEMTHDNDGDIDRYLLQLGIILQDVDRALVDGLTKVMNAWNTHRTRSQK